jgi:hypothetical protein
MGRYDTEARKGPEKADSRRHVMNLVINMYETIRSKRMTPVATGLDWRPRPSTFRVSTRRFAIVPQMIKTI